MTTHASTQRHTDTHKHTNMLRCDITRKKQLFSFATGMVKGDREIDTALRIRTHANPHIILPLPSKGGAGVE